MNKLFTFIAITCFAMYASAQTSIPNGGFEDWTSSSIEYPSYYINNSNIEASMKGFPSNLVKSTDAYHGIYAVQLTSVVANDMFGYLYNSPSQSDPDQWTGGAPIVGTPTGIRGYYKYNVASGDTATVIVSCRKNGNSIGMYLFNMGGNVSNYTLFDFEFQPALMEAPDSIVVAFASSDVMNERFLDGSTLLIDSISLTGLVTQPNFFNGDFEEWTTETMYSPDTWKVSAMKNGVIRSTDSYEGTYALELTSMLDGDRNRSSSVMTGEWKEITPGDYQPTGGYPYTEIKDTVSFYYKYSVGIEGDTAIFMAFFKKDGAQIAGLQYQLTENANYSLVQIPFEIQEAPDTIIIAINSGNWGADSIIFAGAVLKIDDIKFKSESVTTSLFNNSENKLNVYPNPSSSSVYISLPNCSGEKNIVIKDIQGKVVATKTISSTSFMKYCTFDTAGLSNGMYVVSVTSDNNTMSTKFSVQH